MVSKSRPIKVLSWIFNRKSLQLENLLAKKHLSIITRKRIILEIRQLNHMNLSGIIDSRLANAAVLLTTRFQLRSHYLKRWRIWLTENEGKIEFNNKQYWWAWHIFVWVLLPMSTLFFGMMVYLFSQSLGTHYLPIIILGNTLWWFPWLLLIAIPSPNMTREMQNYINRFNAG